MSYASHRFSAIPETTKPWMTGGVVLLVLLLTVAIYAPGLHGPFLLDDTGNLEPLSRWFHGQLGWQGVVLGNRSGPTGRPFSMLTFLLDVQRTGNLNAFSFKPTNLVIHLICGGLVFLLCREILRAAEWPPQAQRWVPVALMTIWLWMPIQVSTVLYVIQRMAQLSALWTLATLTLFLYVRRRLTEGHSLANLALLWTGVPALAVIATLSKENGALALPLAAVAEWTLFDRSKRLPSVTAFFVITVLVPWTCAAIYIAAYPAYFSRGYGVRDFTLAQRLLTEPRILWDYATTSFIPTGARLGIYHDNYVASKSFSSPFTTAASITAWIVVTAWAFCWRRRAPLFTFGVLAYLVAHIVESGPIALELYFEHRNYLPSAFALVALAGLLQSCVAKQTLTIAFWRTGVAAIVAITAIYGLSSLNQASAWASEEEFHTLQYDYNPTSPRLLSVLAGHAIIDKDLDKALRYIDEGERYSDPSEQGTSTLWRFLAYCETGKQIPEPIYKQFEQRAKGRITNFAMVGWDLLADRVDRGCPGMDTMRVANTGKAWADRSTQPSGVQPMWRTRYDIGRMIATTGDLASAEAIVHSAWLDSDHNNGVGVLLFQLNASLGNIATCREVLGSLERAAHGDDQNLNSAVKAFREAMPQLESASKP